MNKVRRYSWGCCYIKLVFIGLAVKSDLICDTKSLQVNVTTAWRAFGKSLRISRIGLRCNCMHPTWKTFSQVVGHACLQLLNRGRRFLGVACNVKSQNLCANLDAAVPALVPVK